MLHRHWSIEAEQVDDSCAREPPEWPLSAPNELFVRAGDIGCPQSAEFECLGIADMWYRGGEEVTTFCTITVVPSVIGTYNADLALAHEFGHCLGFEHGEGIECGIMSELIDYACAPNDDELRLVEQEYCLR